LAKVTIPSWTPRDVQQTREVAERETERLFELSRVRERQPELEPGREMGCLYWNKDAGQAMSPWVTLLSIVALPGFSTQRYVEGPGKLLDGERFLNPVLDSPTTDAFWCVRHWMLGDD
jgi:hypothetical protein